MPMIDFIDAESAQRRLSPASAVEALRATLRDGFRPEDDHDRIFEPLSRGELLMMPSETPSVAGVKVLTITPDNPARGLPRIQGIYLLLDAVTLAPTYLIDGPALTDLRTSAVSMAATKDFLLAGSGPLEVVVHGAGPQGQAHVRTLADLLRGQRELGTVRAVVRNPGRVNPGVGFDQVLTAGSDEAASATSGAGLIICATTASTPLFSGELVRDDAVVVAVGSHSADVRELDAELMGRSSVIVEDRQVALREAGDVIMAIAEGAMRAEDLLPMADVITGVVVPEAGRPVVFKSSGMSWEDVVIAEAIARAAA